MNALARGIKQFTSVPVGDKIPVLLANPSIFANLVDGGFESILDQEGLQRQIDNVSDKLGLKKIDNWIGALSEVFTGVILTPDGFPGKISIPIFPFRAANKINLKPIQYVERDALKVESFLQYFGMFKHFHGAQKLRVIFSAENIQEAEGFFSNIQDSIDLYRIFPDGLKSISSDINNVETTRYFDYLLHGSCQQASQVDCEYPALSSDFECQRQAIIKNYFAAMAKQMQSRAFSAQASQDIATCISHIDQLIVQAETENINFLIAAKIQFLLLRILVEDDDKDGLYEAITLSRAIQNRQYESKCLRFSNQIAGVSSYAIDQLEQSIKSIARLSRSEAFNPVHMLEFYAASQNLFITRLFNRKPSIDTGEAVNCLAAAEEQDPYFNELGMLANSVGMSFLCQGSTSQAIDYFIKAVSYSADHLTHLNIKMNLAIAHQIQGNSASETQLEMLFNEYRQIELGPKSQYHAAMMFGNLWRITKSRDLRIEIEKESAKRKFITQTESGHQIISHLKKRGFLFMRDSSFTGEYGRFLENSGLMPAFHFNWSTPVVGASV